jgi:hypothetical protein
MPSINVPEDAYDALTQMKLECIIKTQNPHATSMGNEVRKCLVKLGRLPKDSEKEKKGYW